jgi:hypothetical protein
VVCAQRTDTHETARRLVRLRRLFEIGLLLLLTQFLSGMAVNVWVSIPAHHIGSDAHNYFVGLVFGIGYASAQAPLLLQLHVAIAVLLVTQAITAAVWTLRGGDGRLIASAWTSLIAIIGAGFNGGNFVNGLDPNLSSYLMSVAFAVTAVSDVLAWGRIRLLLLGTLSKKTNTASGKRRN